MLKDRKRDKVLFVVLFTLYLKDDVVDGVVKDGVEGGKPLALMDEKDREKHEKANNLVFVAVTRPKTSTVAVQLSKYKSTNFYWFRVVLSVFRRRGYVPFGDDVAKNIRVVQKQTENPEHDSPNTTAYLHIFDTARMTDSHEHCSIN